MDLFLDQRKTHSAALRCIDLYLNNTSIIDTCACDTYVVSEKVRVPNGANIDIQHER